MRNLCLLFCLSFCWIACDETAPCSLTLCDNGGVCVEGVCQCAPGYGGNSCQELELPATYRITGITVSRVPQTDASGQAWDALDGPDLYLRLTRDGTVAGPPTIVVENAATADTYLFELQGGWEVSAGSTVQVEMLDADPGSVDEPMALAQSTFTGLGLVLAGGGYADVFSFETNDPGVANIELLVEWGF